jgi:dihydroxyacid dehydratase/phosphogluconate dehydratase
MRDIALITGGRFSGGTIALLRNGDVITIGALAKYARLISFTSPPHCPSQYSS